MQEQPTVIGIMLFAGLLAGVIVGNWLPFPASYEAIAGGIVGWAVGLLIDKARANKAGR